MMFNFNRLKYMTTEWKRLTYGKLFWLNFNRAVKAHINAWKAPLRLMGVIK